MTEVDEFYEAKVVCDVCLCETVVGWLVHVYDFCGRCGNKIIVWSCPGEPLRVTGGHPASD